MVKSAKLNFFILLLLLTSLFPGCNYDIVNNSEDLIIPAEPVKHNGVVAGFVYDNEGNPIQNVSVSVGNVGVHTNDDGFFALSELPRNERTVVKFRKRYYLSMDRYCNAEFGGIVYFEIILSKQTDYVEISGYHGGELTDDNIIVEIPPSAFIYVNWNFIVRDPIDFAATYIKSSSNQFSKMFTGEFIGFSNSNSSPASFESFGLLELKFNVRGFNEFQPIRNEVPANLTISIPESLQDNPPQNLTTWYYDSTDVRWYEEGILTLEGDSYVGTTSHFTYLTWGNYFDESFLTGRAIDIAGHPVTNGTIIAEGDGYNCRSSCSLDENGYFNLRVKSSSSAKLHLLCNGNISSPYEISSTPSQGNTEDLGNVSFNNPIGSVTLVWGLYPDDLDAHLLVPASNNGDGPVHINFAERGDLNNYPFSSLRKDDSDSFGPEIIDLNGLVEGRYVYFVHNVSGENNGVFAYSNAIVKLEINNSIYMFEIPESNEESCDAWHVFDLIADGEGGCEVALIDEMINKRVLLSNHSMNKYSALPK